MLKMILAAGVLALSACTAAPPVSDAPVTPAAMPAWNAAALDGIVAYAKSQKTTGFLIIQDGKTVTEHNWPLPDDDASQTFGANFVHGAAGGALREDVASQQKSFIAILIGAGVDKGLVDVEKSVTSYIGAGWSKATPEQEAAIKVRNLLEMNSGLKENLSYEAPAGAKFFYNTPAYAILKPVLEKASGMPLHTVTQMWLTKIAGMHDTAWEQRPAVFADVGNPTGLVTTPRDIAKMGQLVLDRGVASSGARVISEAQLDLLLTPSATNPSYGRLWWLNGGAYSISPGAAAPRRDGQLIGVAPSDLVAALGAADRKLFVVPSMKLIVVRTGQAAPDRDFNDKLWQMLMQAAPKH